MPVYRRIISTFRSLFRKEELERELDEELASYLELLTAEKIRSGMSPEEARREARVELGGVGQVKENVRERRVGAMIDTLFQDIRYAIRTLRKNAGFAAVAILVLAIGIGATTALFSTINTALLSSLPFQEPDRLVVGRTTIDAVMSGTVSRVDYFDYRENGRSFDELAALTNFTMPHTMMGEGKPELVEALYVTWNLFPALGANPIVGRHFVPEEEIPGSAAVTLISYGLWQSRFGGNPDVVGSKVDLDGFLLTVVGVMPRGFRFLFEADLWRLVDRDGPYDSERHSHSHVVVGRLKSGVTMDQAQSEMDAISSGLAEQYPESNAGKGLLLSGLHSFMVRNVRLSLLLLMGTTVLVLLIACGNVAGLLLARGERRQSEMGMRSALGATRSRLVRQLLTETMMLTGVAGLIGVAIAYLFQGLVLRLLPVGELGMERPVINSAALVFTLLVSVATGLLVGVVPALRRTATDPGQQLRSATRASEGVQSSRMRSGLVVLQVALSVALLIGSGLLIRSFVHLSTVDPGFDPDNLLTGQLQIQRSRYPTPEERSLFFSSLLEDVRALPGVVSATLINKLPIRSPWQSWGVWPAEEAPPPVRETTTAVARWVPPGYFATMGIPLIAGRDIAATDVPGSPYVMVLSETAAQRLFQGSDPIGRMVNAAAWRTFEVVGVVRDARLNTLRGAPDAAMYLSHDQMGSTRAQIAVRSSGDPTVLRGPIDDLLAQKDPDVLFAKVMTMASVLADEEAGFRIVLFSLVLFSGVAIALTAIGLYGVLAYDVSQRLNEVGVRMAMGASNGDVLRMILRRGLLMTGIGLLLGVAGAYPGTLLLRQLLYETPRLDATTYVGAVGFLGLVATLACLLPAWRATQVDPVEVLRKE
jgi:predicted permease